MTDRVLCSKCGADDVIVYEAVDAAICPKCCDDHEYEYESREYFCRHCGDPPPDDWHQSDDDVGLWGVSYEHAPGEPIGTPASAMDGNASNRHNNPAGWANWVAFCERNGMP